jgi:hypothetical protein
MTNGRLNERTGTSDPALLELAGRAGVSDERIGGAARDLFELALAGAEALGPDFISPADLEEARAFFQTYTARSLSPADDALAACPCAGD